MGERKVGNAGKPYQPGNFDRPRIFPSAVRMTCLRWAPMRWLLLVLTLLVAPDPTAAAASLKKVLPHYVDNQGRHMLAPSLYERDAYQAHLRRNPELRAGLQFDVQ